MKNSTRGFTLIEMLVYMAIATLMLGTIVVLYYALESARLKQQSIAEVEGQGAQAMTLMTQDIRNAEAITIPATSTSGASLSISTYTASTSPTVFSLSGSTLQITEGASVPVALTSSQVQVSNLSFQNLSRSGTSGSAKIQFTISEASTTGEFDTTYAKTFYGSATVRRLQQ